MAPRCVRYMQLETRPGTQYNHLHPERGGTHRIPVKRRGGNKEIQSKPNVDWILDCYREVAPNFIKIRE